MEVCFFKQNVYNWRLEGDGDRDAIVLISYGTTIRLHCPVIKLLQRQVLVCGVGRCVHVCVMIMCDMFMVGGWRLPLSRLPALPVLAGPC